MARDRRSRTPVADDQEPLLWRQIAPYRAIGTGDDQTTVTTLILVNAGNLAIGVQIEEKGVPSCRRLIVRIVDPGTAWAWTLEPQKSLHYGPHPTSVTRDSPQEAGPGDRKE